jgi:hypothetical protein
MIHKLKILPTDHPSFASVARMVNPPVAESDKTLFEPAYAGFNIAEGVDVDISYFYGPPAKAPWTTPRNRFDRHLRTEELWMVTEGDFYLPLMACARPEDGEELPTPAGMMCFKVNQGDMFVLKPNVWHCGPWAASPDCAVRFYMFLSGHRKASGGENVDFIVKNFAGDDAVLPDVDELGRPREMLAQGGSDGL